MRIQTENTSFKNGWMLRSCYDFQVYLQCSQRRCSLSQTALLWFKVLPDLLPALSDLLSVLPDAPKVVVGAPMIVVGASIIVVSTSILDVGTSILVMGAPRVVAGAPRCSDVQVKFSPALRVIARLITIAPKILLYQSSEIPVTLKARRNTLIGSDTLLKLKHLSLHATSSQTLLQAPTGYNKFCWCRVPCPVMPPFRSAAFRLTATRVKASISTVTRLMASGSTSFRLMATWLMSSRFTASGTLVSRSIMNRLTASRSTALYSSNLN